MVCKGYEAINNHTLILAAWTYCRVEKFILSHKCVTSDSAVRAYLELLTTNRSL
jgi:hypothetical protein